MPEHLHDKQYFYMIKTFCPSNRQSNLIAGELKYGKQSSLVLWLIGMDGKNLFEIQLNNGMENGVLNFITTGHLEVSRENAVIRISSPGALVGSLGYGPAGFGGILARQF
ncbi:MAG: hypothetical protein O2967_16450 [Proteobacteria bacterium]|nr:hypothetical protein [Pseudomonadota bacterium]